MNSADGVLLMYAPTRLSGSRNESEQSGDLWRLSGIQSKNQGSDSAQALYKKNLPEKGDPILHSMAAAKRGTSFRKEY